MSLFSKKKHDQLEISERLASLGDEFEPDDVPLASLFKYLAVIHGAGDRRKMCRLAEIGNNLAKMALDQFDERERTPTEELEHLIQEGVEIVSGALYHRDWPIAQRGIAKVAFLDDLLKKVNSGEVLLKDSWPDVVGDANG